MTCQSCQYRDQGMAGRFNLLCMNCCVELVLSTHPSKRQAEGMLAAIARHRDAPLRAEILESVRQILERRR